MSNDPTMTVVAEVVWDHLDRVLFETKDVLNSYGEDDAVDALTISADRVAAVFTAIMNPGDPLTLRCRQCGSFPGHACVEGRRGERVVRPHGLRKADLVRQALNQKKH